MEQDLLTWLKTQLSDAQFLTFFENPEAVETMNRWIQLVKRVQEIEQSVTDSDAIASITSVKNYDAPPLITMGPAIQTSFEKCELQDQSEQKNNQKKQALSLPTALPQEVIVQDVAVSTEDIAVSTVINENQSALGIQLEETVTMPPLSEEDALKQIQLICSNGRSDVPYHSAIEYQVLATQQGMLPLLVIEEVTIPDELKGIQFNPETQRLEGVPKVAGNYILIVKWHWLPNKAAHDANSSGIANFNVEINQPVSQETPLELIINPNPDSLWQDIPADHTDPYYKESTAFDYYVLQTGYHLAAASRRGRSHSHVGSFRDDDYYVNALNNGWVIMVVADGAGSAVNSRKGSAIAVHSVGQFFTKKLNTAHNTRLDRQIAEWQIDDQQQLGLLREWFREALLSAIDDIESEATIRQLEVKSYATTLLVTLARPMGNGLFAVNCAIGDGAITAYGADGKIRLLSTPDSGEFAGQTRFLDRKTVVSEQFFHRITIGKWQDVSHLLLLTDGITDPKFETEQQLMVPAHWDALIADITPALNSDNPGSALLEWMKFMSRGHHDDRTIVVLWQKKSESVKREDPLQVDHGLCE
ncbi:PP2C family serine/threonine-protein phosphatase [Ignatzschineria larvae DSM 13226]|uniref:PP2C family serine/threonine-protein phosphatase n=1 Tax=Ignatzschineria larvae DSM 13226 TaxID=1111732 RepID=A0ABZ3BYR3_9GAMM|nr:PP2C family serine/threonine-protein phosphatase [Ignatzschineria larvae]